MPRRALGPAAAPDLSLRALLARHRARLLVVAALGGYFGLVAGLGGYARWGRIGVSSSSFWFGDLASVTSAWECARRGVPVVPANPCDPFGRPANYPRLWLLPAHLGLGQGDTFALGLALAGVYLLAAVLVVPAGERLLGGALYAAALCSPAAMLGVERGNVDLTLFALVVAAVLLAGRRRLVASALCLLVAALLKLFPVFGVGYLLRRARRLGAAVLAAFAAYALALERELRQVVSAVPQGDRFSYGIRRVSEWVGAHTWSGSLRAWDAVLVVAALVVALAGARRVAVATDAPRELDLFLAGAGIYVCTYALARNFDYRLAFLVLCVPQLVRWARQGSRLAAVAIAAALGALWLDEWSPLASPAPPVLAQLVLFGALLTLLAGLLRAATR